MTLKPDSGSWRPFSDGAAVCPPLPTQSVCSILPSCDFVKSHTDNVPGSYPFQTNDPFVLETCPHVFFAGSQPSFKTAVIEGDIPLRLDGGDTEMTDSAGGDSIPRVRLLSIPRFKDTGELILVDTETLEVEVVRFGVFAGQEDKK